MRRTEVALQKAVALQAELATDPEQNKNLEQRTKRKLLQRAAVDEIVTACKLVQATNTELDKSIRETMEITRIALNNDWTTAKNAKILQRHEAGKSLED
jgi:hypothetical protein